MNKTIGSVITVAAIIGGLWLVVSKTGIKDKIPFLGGGN